MDKPDSNLSQCMFIILLLKSIYIQSSAMNQSSDVPSENDFYEHLTDLIRVFKLLLQAFDDTVTLMRNDQDYEYSVHRIRKIIQEEEERVQRHDYSLEPHRQFHSAYQRFICRLVQNLAPSKAKSANEDQHVLLAEEYVIRVESCINFHRKERNLAKLFRRILAYTLKFCEGCDMLLSCCSQNEAVQLLKKEAEEERERSDSENKTIARPPLPQQTESTFQRLMIVFNKRFATISCLDLDYNSFKSYCYMSRNDSDDQLYKDFSNRNTCVSRAITRYSKHFSEYIRKKQKYIMRKNRFRQLKESNKTNENVQTQHEKLYSRPNVEQNKKSRPLFQPKTQESPIISLPSLKQQKKRMLQAQQIRKQESSKGPRTNYQLKSIYLTISKGNDKFSAMHTNNRFMLNYSMPKALDSSKKYSVLRVNETALKSTQAIGEAYSPSILMNLDKNQTYQSYMFDQMLYQSKMAISPRAPIIHKCHKEKKGEKRNIRITNLTFRGPNYSKLSSIIDPQNTTIS